MSSNVVPAYKSLRKMEKLFIGTVLFSCALGIYLIFYFILETLVGLLVSVSTLILLYLYLSKYVLHGSLWLKREIMLYVIMIVMALDLPAYYLSSARVTHSKELKDESVIAWDNFLLGWIFPKGQISLYLDKNEYIGPHTGFGTFFNSILQVFYFIYYLIPYISIYLICFVLCIKETRFRKRSSGVKSQTFDENWSNLFFIFSVYNITYTMIFFVNTLVPASSPRLFIADLYEHPLNLKGIAGFLNKTCKDNKSANSFPSGHVGETICIAYCLFAMKKKGAAVIVLFSSIMIALATLFLRYHYFSDVLAALIISTSAYLFCYHIGYKHRKTDEENTDRQMTSTGLPYTREVEIV